MPLVLFIVGGIKLYMIKTSGAILYKWGVFLQKIELFLATLGGTQTHVFINHRARCNPDER